MVTPSSIIATSLSTVEFWSQTLIMCCTGSLLRRTARCGTCTCEPDHSYLRWGHCADV